MYADAGTKLQIWLVQALSARMALWLKGREAVSSLVSLTEAAKNASHVEYAAVKLRPTPPAGTWEQAAMIC